jgi:homoserine dehydrogenase
MISIAILGYGVVGSGVAEVCRMNNAVIRERVGRGIDIRYILDIRDFPEDPCADRIIHDPDRIINDPDVSVVVETIGGISFAYELSKRALAAGKHVVTSNKELVAKHGPELMRLAAANKVSYLFEASVGGGIPIIRPLYKCLAANIITRIVGILNGTTNYILTRMNTAGIDFASALKEAQAHGYAEQNPSADIDGIDACRKIAILSSITFGEFIDSTKIYTEGISAIDTRDMAYARLLGRKIKLLGVFKRVGNDRADVMVAPMLLDRHHPVAVADDVFNAIEVEGNALGSAMFYGRGAGRMPTASAVVADVIECMMHIDKTPHLILWHESDREILLKHGDSLTEVFLRFNNLILAEIVQQIFTPYGVQLIDEQYPDEFAVIVGLKHNLTEGRLNELLQPLSAYLISRIRMYENA